MMILDSGLILLGGHPVSSTDAQLSAIGAYTSRRFEGQTGCRSNFAVT